MAETNVTRTAKVLVRHSRTCPDAWRGSEWRKCDCRKSLLLYDGTTKKQKRVSAKTRSWEKAEQKAREWLDTFDPVKIELKRLRAEREKAAGAAVRLEQAVGGYLADMVARLGDGSTVRRAYTLLGHVSSDGAVKRNGKLFDWLDRQTARPVLISDITPTHLADWRRTWNYSSDLSSAAIPQPLSFVNDCSSS